VRGSVDGKEGEHWRHKHNIKAMIEELAKERHGWKHEFNLKLNVQHLHLRKLGIWSKGLFVVVTCCLN
jgi:hypothetical protein